MEEAVYEEKYKNCFIRIYQEEEILDNSADWDNEMVFLVNYHKDFYVKNDDIITEEDVQAWYQREKIPQAKQYHIFQLSMLSHSGIWLSLNTSFVSDSYGWDTSHVGIVLVSKKETKNRNKAIEMAQNLIQNWNDNLSGNVYCFKTIDERNGKDIDSVSGYYGDIEKSGIIDEAKASIDNYLKSKENKKADKNYQDFSQLSLGNLLSDKDETIKRNAMSILKTLQRNA